MCGINGIISKKRIDDIDERILNMNKALRHRGPDAGGTLVDDEKKMALGHRRLSIIDIDSRSNQPFILDDNSALVFNGEIYNFKELRNSIRGPIRTESDTEILALGINQYGIEWIKQCNGMFAFCYKDSKTGTVFLARDRFGIKPLYYYWDGIKLLFSSEIKGILRSGLVDASFNDDVIDDYLGYRYVREPYTFFKNIYQLPAGSYISVKNDNTLTITKFWELPEEFNLEAKYDEDSLFKDFKDELNRAVERRLMADVTLGTYLSGGIDSSLITAITSENSDNSVNTYTIGFDELNEFEYARKVSEKYGTRHHEIKMSQKNYFEMLETLIEYKDAPLGVPNEVPLALMSKELKKDITVVLSGEGADELLGGYGKIFRAPFDYQHVDKGTSEDFYTYFINKYEYVPRELRDKYLRVQSPLREKYDKEWGEFFANKPNEENVFRFFHTIHIRGLLQRVDITTMFASVEARVPFLDHQLVEFCYKKIPYDLKLKWNSEEDKKKAASMHAKEYSEELDQPKYLLRRYGLERLPEEIVTRKKMGFPVPLDQWFPEIENMALNILTKAPWVNSFEVEKLCKECKANSRSGQLLWMFLNIEIFRKKYFETNWRY